MPACGIDCCISAIVLLLQHFQQRSKSRERDGNGMNREETDGADSIQAPPHFQPHTSMP